jgi:hypothetical protein
MDAFVAQYLSLCETHKVKPLGFLVDGMKKLPEGYVG